MIDLSEAAMAAVALVYDRSGPRETRIELAGHLRLPEDFEGRLLSLQVDPKMAWAMAHPERFPVEVNRSVSEVVESMQQHADLAGVTLRSELTPEPAFIDGDVFALGRVYRNLILNAIQATAPGGTITVEARTVEDRVIVRIQDTGCGIPPDRLAAIFEDFVTTKRRGLGLADPDRQHAIATLLFQDDDRGARRAIEAEALYDHLYHGSFLPERCRMADSVGSAPGRYSAVRTRFAPGSIAFTGSRTASSGR